MTRIDELLEKRQALVQVAFLIFGDFYIMDNNFWTSETGKELYDIEEELDLLGYEEVPSLNCRRRRQSKSL